MVFFVVVVFVVVVVVILRLFQSWVFGEGEGQRNREERGKVE